LLSFSNQSKRNQKKGEGYFNRRKRIQKLRNTILRKSKMKKFLDLDLEKEAFRNSEIKGFRLIAQNKTPCLA